MLSDIQFRLLRPADEFVYFIQVAGNGPIKIGYSNNPLSRLQNLQTQCPFKLVLLFAIPGGRLLERQLLREFAPCNIHGEWFWPVEALMARIRDLEQLEGSRCFWEPDATLRRQLTKNKA